MRSIGRLLQKYLPQSLIILVVVLVTVSIGWAAFLRFFGQRDWAAWTEFGDYSTTTTSRTTTRNPRDPSAKPSISETTTEITQRGKTFWDVLDLLIVPITLALLAVFFNWRQNLNQQRVAQNNLWEAVYQKYLDELRALMLEKKLIESREGSAVRNLARAYTLTIFRDLDRGRKSLLLQFLNESELVVGDSPVISLAKVDLDGVDLSGLDLNGINLSEARLSRANLSRAYLARANLQSAVLKRANLRDAYLEQARLSEADLENADLEGAFLPEAVLSGAILVNANLINSSLEAANLEHARVTVLQLAEAKSLIDTILPDGTINQGDQLDTQ